MRLVLRVAVALASAAVLTACTAQAPAPAPPGPTETITSVVTHTAPPPPITFRPAPATSAAPLPPGAPPPRGEVEKPCPYILSSQDQGPHSMADLEGDRIYRTTVITTTNPVGCRFYFWAPPFEATADILPQRFASATQAHNAMVLTALAASQATSQTNIVPGVDAVLYRTKFFGPDGATDWACAFAKGRLLVIVHTQQNDTSLNALNIAIQIAPKF